MAIKSIYLRTTADEAKRQFGAFEFERFGLKVEFIPANGGCVMAVIPVEPAAREFRRPNLPSPLRGLELKRAIANAVASLTPLEQLEVRRALTLN